MSTDRSVRFAYEILTDQSLVYASMLGELTGDDMLYIVGTIQSDPRWHMEFDTVWDCSRVSAHVMLPDEVTPLIDGVTDGKPGRDVLIQSRSMSGALLADFLAVRARLMGKEVHIADTLEQACQALGYDAVPEAITQIEV